MQQITYKHHSITPHHVIIHGAETVIHNQHHLPLVVQTFYKIKQCFLLCMYHTIESYYYYLEVDYSIHSRYNHVSTRFA